MITFVVKWKAKRQQMHSDKFFKAKKEGDRKTEELVSLGYVWWLEVVKEV